MKKRMPKQPERTGLPLYCLKCSKPQGFDHTVDECWHCHGKDFTTSLSAIQWEAAVRSHSGNLRFLRSIKVDPA